MRKLAMLLLVAITLTVGSVAYAEPPDPCFYDDEFEFLNPQPLPPG
jgi:hypothetical protein